MTDRLTRAFTDAPKTLFWIVAIALAVRVLLLIGLHDSYYTAGMAQGELARNLVHGRGFVVNIPFSDSLARLQADEGRLISIDEAVQRLSPQDHPGDFHPFIAYMMPGQGMLLALTAIITGHLRYIDLQVLQALADALSVVMIFGIGRHLFSTRVGLVAALLCALYIPTARLAISATRDAWMPLMYVTITYFAVLGWKRGRAVYFLATGAAVGIGSYFRSEILLIPIFLAVGLLLLRWKEQRFARLALLGMIPIIVLLLPWTARNVAVFHRFIPTNSGLWMAMWQSFGEYQNDFGAANNDMITLQHMRAEGHQEDYDTPEYDDLFREKVLNVMRHHPGWVAWTMVRRLARIPLQMHSWGIPQTDEMTAPGSSYAQAGRVDQQAYWQYLTADPLRFVVQLTARALNAFLFIAAAIVLVRLRRVFGRDLLFLLLIPSYNILIHVVIGVHARYIVPTNALLLIPLALLFVGTGRDKGTPELQRSASSEPDLPSQ